MQCGLAQGLAGFGWNCSVHVEYNLAPAARGYGLATRSSLRCDSQGRTRRPDAYATPRAHLYTPFVALPASAGESPFVEGPNVHCHWRAWVRVPPP